MAIDFLKYINPKHAYPHDLHENWADSDCARSIEDMIKYHIGLIERPKTGTIFIDGMSPMRACDVEIGCCDRPKANQTIISTPVPPMLTKEDMKAISESLFEGL